MSTQPRLTAKTVTCPICFKDVISRVINEHIDSSCKSHLHPLVQETGLSKSSSAVAPKMLETPCKSVSTVIGQSNKKQPRVDLQTTTSTNRKRAADDDASRSLTSAKRNRLTNLEAAAPLAERLRPNILSDFVGQAHLTNSDSLLMKTLTDNSGGSMIFWGPPGCGKTTLARLIAKEVNCIFKELSATVVGINDVRLVLDEAKNTLALTGRRTILFLDEVHRFNRSQQDIFLPYLEQGHIQLVGATTENPSFRLTGALLSRCRVFTLERLSDDDIQSLLLKAVKRVKYNTDDAVSATPSSDSRSPDLLPSSASSDIGHLCSFPPLTQKVLHSVTSLAAGDARIALSLLEVILKFPEETDESILLNNLKRSVSTSYDKSGESHYNMISALHKSVRGSQGSAAMYWLARMLNAGEDPLYIARRLVVCASEDIGLADSHALPLAMAALQACQTIGMPECRINLAHVVAYLSEAPKSTRSYEAYNRAEDAAKLDPTIPVPMSMRNAPTNLMKEWGYGETYLYNPSYAHPVHNTYMPIQFRGEQFLKAADDNSDKIWDEDALSLWEAEDNNENAWEGRQR